MPLRVAVQRVAPKPPSASVQPQSRVSVEPRAIKRSKPARPEPVHEQEAAPQVRQAPQQDAQASDPLALLPQQPAPSTGLAQASVPTAAASGPAAPPETLADYVSTQYPDVRPYGRTVLLLVLIDAEGAVHDVKVAVPSERTLQDLTLALGLRDSTFKHIDPPLAPQEMRWVELRFDYGPSSQELLP